MEKQISTLSDKTWLQIISVISVVIVAVVALLMLNSQQISSYDSRIYMLPKLNAFLNSSVSILLMAGFYFIRVKKNLKWHRACMLSAFIFSVFFLVSYITYHSNAPDTKFGDINFDSIVDAQEKLIVGNIRYVYLFILLTHIVLASIIVPMALLTLYRIWKNQTEKHKKIARWTFPIWLYVSITGVVVYLMISPYYPV